MNQMAPILDDLRRRYGLGPEQWLADEGFARHEQIEAVAAAAAGCTPYLPVMAAKNDARDRHTPREGDNPAIARWRERMASDDARAMYIRSAAPASSPPMRNCAGATCGASTCAAWSRPAPCCSGTRWPTTCSA
jgi:hypothetical protein